MKNEILDIIMCDNVVLSRRLSESFFKKNHIKLYTEIVNHFKETKIKFIEMLYLIINDIKYIPKCKICDNPVRFKNFTYGYINYCSMKCIGLDDDVKKKREKTNNNKYGGNYTFNSSILREKIKKTNINKYGVEYPQQLESTKEKTKQTNIKKYGVEQHLKLLSQVNKLKQSNLKKYGVDNVNKLKSVRKKRKETNIKKYGIEYPQQLNETKTKTRETNQKKYGVEFIFQDKNFKSKAKITNLIKYGTEIPSKSEIIKNKIVINNKITKQEKYKKYWSKNLNLSCDDIVYDDDNNIKLNNYCKKHNEFIITKGLLKNRLRFGINNICTKCNPVGKNSSTKEIEIRDFIENVLNINTEKYKINNQEIDIFLPDYKIGIEFNGLYWHSNLYKSNNYHLNKTNLCEKQGIQLLHIFEDEWINNKEIIKSIIKSKLGLFNDKIYARKTEIREITNNKIVKKFLNDNHLQGNINSSVKLGLFFNNELVSLMTFGKKRVALGNRKSKTNNNNYLGNEYELLRFCSKLNTNIIGGASKLLNYFIKNYQPKEIITFADKRYSNGDLYKKLGFEFIKNTKPNYWYFNNKIKEMIKYHRYNFRKDLLVREGFDKSKTEKEIMEERGYLHIYDCGNMKFKR